MKKMLNAALLLSAFLVCSSCGFLAGDTSDSPKKIEVFDSFWQTVDERYVFFALKGVDWDYLYELNRPLIDDTTSSEELWNIMTGMLAPFNDGHLNLIRGDEWWSLFLEDGYLPETHFSLDRITSGRLSNYGFRDPLTYGMIGNIGYVYVATFATAIAGADVDFLVNYFSNADGIIIDVRDNTGGNASNGDILQSRFTDVRIHVEDLFFKAGAGHDDFSAPRAVYIDPAGPNKYLKPVIVLTNERTFSAASFFASRMSVMPQVILAGMPSGGGGGSPETQTLPNGWVLRYPAFFSQRPDGLNFEAGVPVDYEVSMDEADAAAGIDTQLEYALSLLEGL